jgi:hypothetical protein
MSNDKPSLNRSLAELKSEIKQLSKSHPEHARSIAQLAELAHHEAKRKEKSPRLFRHALEGLALSAKGFEASHPKLVDAINELCEMLAQIGI